jgi:hypothetical protein
MVHAEVPLPVPVVLAVAPVQVELVVPELVANPRLVLQLLMSAATLAKIATTFPVTGAVLDVMVVVLWAPVVERLLTRVAQLVAVTVPAEATLDIAVCPQPASPELVLQIALRLAWNPL